MRSEHILMVEKRTERKVAAPKVVAQVTRLMERGLAGGRKERGWAISSDPEIPRYNRNGSCIYRYRLLLTYKGKERTSAWIEAELNSIVRVIATAGNTPKWAVISVDGQKIDESPTVTLNDEGQETVDYAPVIVPNDWQRFFVHIYDRECQIEIILSQIQAAIDSNWTNRFHSALVGEPACGKTEVARAFKRMLGDQAVLELDATGTTMAGAIKMLDESRQNHQVPRVLIIEEIEKADFKNYPWLLAMLDPRAEIRKINYRSRIHMEAKMLCIATINNFKLFKSALEGALASRFAEPIFFPRPGEETLRKILMRDIVKINGKEEWIDPAIEYAMSTGTSDPRHILAVCLAGKDGLLDGSYQEKLRKTRIPQDYYKS